MIPMALSLTDSTITMYTDLTYSKKKASPILKDLNPPPSNKPDGSSIIRMQKQPGIPSAPEVFPEVIILHLSN
jgi:hypothetical protein